MAATDSTRVLRLPGFPNHKLPEEFIVQAREESDAVYTVSSVLPDQVTGSFPATERRVNTTNPRGIGARHSAKREFRIFAGICFSLEVTPEPTIT